MANNVVVISPETVAVITASEQGPPGPTGQNGTNGSGSTFTGGPITESMSVPANHVVSFNGGTDGNWAIGVDTGSLPSTFSTTHVLGPSIFKIIHGTGPNDGFAIGGTGGASELEIDNDGNTWIMGGFSVVGNSEFGGSVNFNTDAQVTGQLITENFGVHGTFTDHSGGNGTSGQVLTSTGTEVLWQTPAAGAPTDSPTFTGSTTISGLNVTSTAKFNSTTWINGALWDGYGLGGNNGQILTSVNNGTNAVWANQPTPSLPGITADGSNIALAVTGISNSISVSTNFGTIVTFDGLGDAYFQGTAIFANATILNSSLSDVHGSTGTNGQVLTSTGTATAWATMAAPVVGAAYNGSNNLNAGAAPWQVVNDASYIFSLPDATTLQVGATFNISNMSGGNPIIVEDHTGGYIANVPNTDVRTFVLLNKSTAVGAWFTFLAGTGATIVGTP